MLKLEKVVLNPLLDLPAQLSFFFSSISSSVLFLLHFLLDPDPEGLS